MTIRKTAVLIIITLICLTSLAGCRKQKENEENRLTIGFAASPEIFLQERWERDIKIFTSKAKEMGAEVILAKSQAKDQDQSQQIQYLLKQDIDVLVVIPKDRELLSGIIRKVLDRGIPVLGYDRPILGVAISGYVSFDNREVGRLLGRALLQKVPDGNYVIINGSVHDNNSFEVSRGLHEILDKEFIMGDINLIEEIWLERWSYDETLEKLGAVFEMNPDIDAISAANDHVAQAAIRILAERRLAGKVAVVGQDADLLACQSVVEGTQLMTVYKPLHRLAERAAEIAVAMAKGEQPEADSTIDNGSGQDIPYYMEKPIAVYRDDIEDIIIADGFHSYEDVYRSETGQN